MLPRQSHRADGSENLRANRAGGTTIATWGSSSTPDAGRSLDSSKRYLAELVDATILTLIDSAIIVGALASEVSYLFPTAIAFAVMLVLAYDTVYIARRGQTPGKKTANIRVVMFEGGAIPSVGASFRRALIKLLFGFPGLSFILYASVFFSLNGRGPHDVAAGTVVVSDG